MKFRLWTILWVFALLASAMATFPRDPILGCLLAVYVCFAWHFIFGVAHRGIVVAELFVFSVISLLIWGIFNPAISRSYEPERVADCHTKFTHIVEAVLNYHQQHKCLPANGRYIAPNENIHSWRELILWQPNVEAAVPQYDRSKPWNSPRNLSFAQKSAPKLCCRNDTWLAKDGKTQCASYFAVTGEGTAWNALSSPKKEFRDDPRTTILLLEQLEREIAWTEPRDLNFDQAVALLTTDPESKGISLPHHWAAENRFFMKPSPRPMIRGLHAAFADGSVRFVPLPLSVELAAALLTANGGEKIPETEFAKFWKPEVNYARVYSFTVFALISLLPAVKLFK